MTLPLTSGIPANYQNSLYWQYFMASLNDFQRQLDQRQSYINSIMSAQNSTVNNKTLEEAVPRQTQALQEPPANQTFTVMTPTKDGKVYIVEDGKDDGKISAGKKVSNLFKGVGNFFKGMVCDENGKFSLKRTLTTVAIAAGATALTIATGGAAAPFLVATGAAMGAVEVGKGAYRAATAKTDAEAEAAWQSIGSGVTGVGLSVAGAKGALKAAKVDVSSYKGANGALKATVDTVKYSKNKIKDGYHYVKENGISKSAKTAKDTLYNNSKTNWASYFKSSNAKSNTKQAYDTKYDKKIEAIFDKEVALNKKLIELEKNPIKNKEKISSIKNELNSLNNERTRLTKLRESVPENVHTVDNSSKIAQLNAEIEELKFIKQTLPEAADMKAIEAELALKIAQRTRLYQQQTVSGIRKAQIKNLEAGIENAKKVNKELYKGDKAHKQHVTDKEFQLAELKDFAKTDRFTEIIEAAKARLPKLEKALKQTKDGIETVKNNQTITEAERAKALANLELRQSKLEALINTNKKNIAKAKRGLHKQNAKVFEHQFRKPVGYPTIAITGGGVTELNTLNEEDAFAIANGYPSAAVMKEALELMQQEMAQQQAQNIGGQYTTNPYTSSINSAMTMQQPVGTGLEFQDLYVSPYPQMI